MNIILKFVIFLIIFKTIYNFLRKTAKKEQISRHSYHIKVPPQHLSSLGRSEKPEGVFSRYIVNDPAHEHENLIHLKYPLVMHQINKIHQKRLLKENKTDEKLLPDRGKSYTQSAGKKKKIQEHEYYSLDKSIIKVYRDSGENEALVKENLLTFDNLSIIQHGIILSEILLPPVSKRNSHLPPYIRR